MTGHLVHIGYPKTGSNFLRRWFAGHQQLAYAEGGIAGFTSVYDIAREGAAPREGLLYRVTSAEGLATPHVHVGAGPIRWEGVRKRPMPDAQARVCSTLAALFPNAHVLVVTRGFRSMIRSAYSQYVRTGGDEAFETFCDRTREGNETGQDAWRYDYLLGLYRDAFPGRVIALPYELLRDDARAFLARIEETLGLERHDPVLERQNPSLSPVELAWYPRLTRGLRALPFGRRIEGRYLRMALANRLSAPIRLLQRLRPLAPVHPTIPEGLLAGWEGRAEPFRDDPLYAPYAEDYLLR